jgi:tyrosine-protein phosphatase SIW14
LGGNEFGMIGGRARLCLYSENGMKRELSIFCGIFLAAWPGHFFGKPQATSTVATSSAISAKRIYVPGVPNAAQVDERLYRGAQPRGAGVRALKEMGVTTIVDLRDEEKTRIAWEQRTAETLGMRFVNIPVNGWAAPSDQQVAMFLEIFRDNPTEKVFVHCRFGDDRTGVFVATYRMAFDQASWREALREMNQFGFNWMWHRNMSAFVREFPEHLENSPALVEFKSPL